MNVCTYNIEFTMDRWWHDFRTFRQTTTAISLNKIVAINTGHHIRVHSTLTSIWKSCTKLKLSNIQIKTMFTAFKKCHIQLSYRIPWQILLVQTKNEVYQWDQLRAWRFTSLVGIIPIIYQRYKWKLTIGNFSEEG